MTTARMPWLVGAGMAAVLALAIGIGTTLGGGSGDGITGAAKAAVSIPPSDADVAPRDVTSLTTGAATGSTAPAAATESSTSRSQIGSTPTPAPLTWQQEVAANPTAPVRVNPVASDWTVEQVIIGQDLAGKFLARINVRYTGPGSARGTFALTILRAGREVTTLTGSSEWVRAGVWPIILTNDANYVDGPWTTQFRVVSTST